MAEILPTVTKHCPVCGAALTIRTNRRTKTDFLACTNFPECRYNEPETEYLKMRRLGAPTLF